MSYTNTSSSSTQAVHDVPSTEIDVETNGRQSIRPCYTSVKYYSNRIHGICDEDKRIVAIRIDKARRRLEQSCFVFSAEPQSGASTKNDSRVTIDVDEHKKVSAKEKKEFLRILIQNKEALAFACQAIPPKKGSLLLGVEYAFLYRMITSHAVQYQELPPRQTLLAKLESEHLNNEYLLNDLEYRNLVKLLNKKPNAWYASEVACVAAIKYLKRLRYDMAQYEYETEKDIAALAHEMQIINSLGMESQSQCFADIPQEKVTWLWEKYIPLGMVTIIDGDPGLGKSFLTCDIAARVTCGWDFPPASGNVQVREPAAVLMINLEDDASRTIRPRFTAAGGNLQLLHRPQFKDEGAERPVTLPEDIIAIMRIVIKHNIKLIIVDPLMAALSPKVDSYKDSPVRRVMARLKLMAEETQCAVVLIRHLTKDTKEKNPLYRGGGSIGISAASRSGFILGKHPKNEAMRVLAPVKYNLCLTPDSLAFRLQDMKLHWKGAVKVTADELVNRTNEKGRPPKQIDAAMMFLRGFLADGPRKQEDIMQAALAAGHKERTLIRAKRAMKMESIKKKKMWFWSLSKDFTSKKNRPLDALEKLDPRHRS